MPLQETLQVQLQQKRKKTNEEDSGNDMMRNWEPPHVLTQWVDDKKQRHLVILVVLPTGIAHEDTTNCLIEVDRSQLQVHVKVIWPDNATHIHYLTQHMHREWHVEEKNLRMKLALEDAMNQMRKRETDFVRSKFSLSLPFMVQSRFDYEFMYDTTNGFRALLISLHEPDAQFEGGMKHKMVRL